MIAYSLLVHVFHDCQHRDCMLEKFLDLMACGIIQTGEIFIQVSGKTDRCICMVMVISGRCGL